jgi:competence protein ComEA
MRRNLTAVRLGVLVALLLGGLQTVHAAGSPSASIDLNQATVEDLAKLPGIGPAKAQAIAQHRSQHPFTRIDELRQVKGIGAKLYDQLKDQVTVGEAPAAPKGHGG